MNPLLVVALLSSSVLFGVEISVSPRGKISTLRAARDAVRTLRASGEKGDIDVVIENGTYALDETLIFGLKDSAPAGAVTRYRAANGARPVISGGRRSFSPIFGKMGVKNPFAQWVCEKDTREHSRTIRWEEINLGNIEDWASYEPYMHARENVIEFNEVHDCLKLLHDGNCIYLSGNGKGNIVRYNVLYNHPEGSMIRTDDDSHGAVVSGNLMFGTTGNCPPNGNLARPLP